MKKLLLGCAVAAMFFASCAGVKSPLAGSLYLNLAAGNSATGNTLGSKVGKASAKSILGLIATGDVSIETAAKSAGIKKISHIDENVSSILGIISTYEIVVYGE